MPIICPGHFHTVLLCVSQQRSTVAKMEFSSHDHRTKVIEFCLNMKTGVQTSFTLFTAYGTIQYLFSLLHAG